MRLGMVLFFLLLECNIYGSSEIWSDKVSLLHIKGTQRRGEHGDEADNLTEVSKAQRATEV